MTKSGRIMLLSKCTKCNSKKSTFIKEQQARRLLRSSGIRTPLMLGPLLFEKCKMTEIKNKFLLTEDKFILKMLLKQPGLTYSATGLFTKNKERIQDIFIKIN